jgi:hypothetical protein
MVSDTHIQQTHHRQSNFGQTLQFIKLIVKSFQREGVKLRLLCFVQ